MGRMLRARALKPGDTVAVAALSSGLEPDEAELFEQGVRAVEGLGFAVRVVAARSSSAGVGGGCRPPQADVAAELNGLLRDTEVRAILALTGGRFDAVSYLDLIDFEAVRARSQAGAGVQRHLRRCMLALHARTGLVTLALRPRHARVRLLGRARRRPAAGRSRGRLSPGADRRRRARAVYRRLGSVGVLAVRAARRGPLIGGLLNRMVRVQATPYALAARDASTARCSSGRRSAPPTRSSGTTCTCCVQAGVLDRIAGMIVGPHEHGRVDRGGPGRRSREVVLDVLGDRDIPVLGNVDIGHEPPNVPLPLGVRAEVDADAASITLLEPALIR